MLANICQNVVRSSGSITTGYALYLDAGDATSNTGSGATWYDLSGNGSDVTWNGGYGRGGSGSTAYFTLDGSSGTYANRTGLSFTGTTGTFSIWVYYTTTGNGYYMFQAASDYHKQLVLAASGNSLYWQGCLVNPTYTWNMSSNVAATGGLWFNHVGTWDGTTVNLYINGVLAATTAQLANIGGPTTPLSIGSLPVAWGYAGALNGRIAKVLVYTTALTGAELLSNYNADKARYGY